MGKLQLNDSLLNISLHLTNKFKISENDTVSLQLEGTLKHGAIFYRLHDNWIKKKVFKELYLYKEYIYVKAFVGLKNKTIMVKLLK